MSTGFSSTSGQQLLNTFLGFTPAQGGYAAPTSFYLALIKSPTTGIGPARSLTGATEWTTADSTSYVRVAYGVGPTNWTPGTWTQTAGATASNAARVQFPAYVAGAASTIYYSVALMDDPTAGTLRGLCDIPNGITVYPGEIVDFEIGQLVFNLL
jgi:hypothetical protein